MKISLPAFFTIFIVRFLSLLFLLFWQETQKNFLGYGLSRVVILRYFIIL